MAHVVAKTVRPINWRGVLLLAAIGLLPAVVLLVVLVGFGFSGELLWLWALFLGSYAFLATILPGSLYLLRQRLQFEDIRDSFLRDVDSLRPTNSSTGSDRDTPAHELEAARLGLDAENQTLGPLFQVFACTMVIAAGWVIVLHSVPRELVDGDQPLFKPIADPITFGFIGGYFFALFSTVRRYFQRDLAPRAYTWILIRLVLTLLISWVLTGVALEMFGNSALGPIAGLMFLVGIIPETGIAVLTDLVRGGLRISRLVAPIAEAQPLTDLEGVSYYDAARFYEEGIYNVENLLRSNLFTLMLRTRLTTDSLVDLFDQAILRIHLAGASDVKRALYGLGVRTATDLELALAAMQPAPVDGRLGSDVLQTRADAVPADLPRRLSVIAAVIADERWYPYVRTWKRLDDHRPQTQGSRAKRRSSS